MKNNTIGILAILALLLSTLQATPTGSNNLTPHLQSLIDPIGHFEGPGQPGSTSWSGDGQKISNPSFEAGYTSPWLRTSYNAGNRSSVQVVPTGYDGSLAVRITLFSANLTIGSNSNLLYDLSQSQAGFNPSARLRAAVMVQNTTGSSSLDRVEISLLLSTSVGSVRTIHYLFSAGTVPTNTAADVYITVPGFGAIGSWLPIDRSLANDASAFGDSSSIDSIQQVALTSAAQSYGRPNYDSHIKYVDTNSNNVWTLGEPVFYDANMDGVYEQSTDTILSCAPPCPVTDGTALKDDPLIRYVDTNGNGVWDSGEYIVYDKNNDGFFEPSSVSPEPVIYPPPPDAPTPNALVMTAVIRTTSAVFDSVELYTASGNTDWIRDGGFETGLTSWYYNASFAPSSSTFRVGTYSARGTVTNGGGEMAQSLDAKPTVDGSTVFTASVNIGNMVGTSPADLVDVWIGLVDKNGNPASVYYYFKTGDGSIPPDRTDTTYHKAPGFGALNQWFSLSVPLIQEEARFNGLGFTAPYRVELIVAEIAAYGGSSTTTAYFDQLSLLTAGYSGSAPSYFYANNGLNSTYVYSADNIPQGSLVFQIPPAQAVLNITSPSGTAIQQSEFSTSTSSTLLTVTIPPSTFFSQPPLGNWRLYTTSSNAAASLYAQDPASMAILTTLNAGSTVNLVSRSLDPLGNPIPAATVTISLWDPSDRNVGFWQGSSDSQGWWIATGIVLPPVGNPPGTYILQVTILAPYAGVRDTQLSIAAILLPVTVTLLISSGAISQGTPVSISGTVVDKGTGNPRPGLAAALSYRRAGNSTWNLLATVTTDTNGRYSYTWTPGQGDYEVQARVGDSQTPTTQSSKSQIIVGPPAPGTFPWTMVALAAVVPAALSISLLLLQRRRPKASPPAPQRAT